MNRNKDILFVWKNTGYIRKELHVYELHYLEKPCAPVVTSWNYNGMSKSDGLTLVNDLRFNDELVFYNDKKYWNVELRDYFNKNTENYWNGLRHKNVEEGIFISNSDELTAEEHALAKQTQEEIKKAIEKHGPIQLYDYDLDYEYQLKKRLIDNKKDLFFQTSI
jgi:hypothetical protein